MTIIIHNDTKQVAVRNERRAIVVTTKGVTGPSGILWDNGDWVVGGTYVQSVGILHGGTSYRVILSHVASADNEPGVGDNWETYWKVLASSSLPIGPGGVQRYSENLQNVSDATPNENDILQAKGGELVTRSPTQFKIDAGLDNVDNTADVNKPISSATQTALDAKADTATVAEELALKADQDDFAVVEAKVAGIEPNADVTDAANVAAAGAVMAVDVPDNDDLSVAGEKLARRDNVLEQMTTLGLPTLFKKYYDVITPYHHGGTDPDDPEQATTNAAAVQAAWDEVSSSFDTSLWRPSKRMEMGGREWKLDPVNMSGKQQPGFIVSNGGFVGAVAGKPQLVLGDSNATLLDDIRFSSLIDTQPSCALLYGRRKSDARAAANHRMSNVDINGYYSEMALCSLGSEVFSAVNLQVRNMSRDLNAVAAAFVDNFQTLTDLGIEVSSDFVTMIDASNGKVSNINITLSGMTSFLRSPSYQIALSSFTRGVASTGVLSSQPSPPITTGNALFFPDAQGVENSVTGETLKGKYLYVAVSGGGGLNLAFYTDAGLTTPFDTSGGNWSDFVSGNVRNRTGPALVLAGACGFVADDIYLLASGNAGIVRDFKNGGSMTSNRLLFQNETLPSSIYRDIAPDSGIAYEIDCEYHSLGRNQKHGTLFTETTAGTGKIESRDCGYHFAQADLFLSSSRVFANAGIRRIGRGTRFYLPNAALMNSKVGFDLFEGEIVTSDGDRTFNAPIKIDNTLEVTGLLTVTGGQIKFPSTRVPSSDPHTLDGVEYGTFTPNLTFTTPGTVSITWSGQSGEYYQWGDMVEVRYSLISSSFTRGTAAGAATITGMPFPSAVAGWSGSPRWGGITKSSYSDVVSQSAGSSATALGLYASGSGQASATVNAADIPSGGSIVLIGSQPYRIA